eukprot:symbB.v1.2.004245.t1/scaffold221.1/size262466/29
MWPGHSAKGDTWIRSGKCRVFGALSRIKVIKKSRFANCHYFPMGRFAWVMVFAVIRGAVALRPETSASLEHNLDVKEKGQHCCATWTAKNPTPTYCWVPASSSCLAWGQKAAVRDYSTVDDKMCKGKGRC